MNDVLQKMSINDTDVVVSVCANCGKEGSDVNNVCNKCKQVRYCNAACKKKHRHKHKNDCEEHLRRAAEHAAKLHDIELFKQPPPLEDCPICFLQLPYLDPTGKKYMACCGKVICSGCSHAPVYDEQGNQVDNQKCPFCRTPHPITEDEIIKRYKIRTEAGDPIAIFNIGMYYRDGRLGYPQDHVKALELWHLAAEYGNNDVYNGIGYAYEHGQGVEVDMKKANHYYELGAMGGDTTARHNLGINEEEAGNTERALKHYMIVVRSGHDDSLNAIKRCTYKEMQQRTITQKHYNLIKYTWVRLRVSRETKLQQLMRNFVIISTME